LFNLANCGDAALAGAARGEVRDADVAEKGSEPVRDS
jgi:hypothetical protein